MSLKQSGKEVILRDIGNQRQAENRSESNLPEVQSFVYEDRLDPSGYDEADLQPASEIYVNGFDLSVGFQASFAQFSTNATLLYAAKGNPKVAILTAVDPYHSGLNLCRYAKPF